MKGCQKKVIFIKNTGSRIFDEAYFIVSREGEASAIEENSLIYEANRIIENSLDTGYEGYGKERRGKVLGFLIPFFIGALVSFSLIFLSTVLFF